jgi:FHA domain
MKGEVMSDNNKPPYTDDPETMRFSRKSFEEVAPPQADTDTSTKKCHICSAPMREGEMICPKCGAQVSKVGTEVLPTQTVDRMKPVTSTFGEVVAPTRFWLEYDRQFLPIEIKEMVVIGRRVDDAEDQPDINLLETFTKLEGISRRHLRIRRNGQIFHVSDLNSTNGTYLNGRRLLPHGERIVRDGDELKIARAPMRVRFNEP